MSTIKMIMIGRYRTYLAIILVSLILSGCVEIAADSPSSDNKTGKTGKIGKNVNISNDTIPPSSISYLRSARDSASINWTWDSPEDKDFSHVMVFIDGKFKVNISKSKNYYNLTRLTAGKQYRIGIRTVDLNNNVNPNWVNDSTSTLPKLKDMVPPDKIWYLEAKVGRTWINWTWENPEDKDYRYANLYIDGKFVTNVTKPKSYYNLTKGLSPNTMVTISIRTVDGNKNINPTWVTNTATTLP